MLINEKKMVNKKIIWALSVIFSLILILFLIRLISPREIDDVTQGIPCENDYLEKSDVLLVIPKFSNISIAENKSWCSQILGLNKTLGMHGVKHEYNEFETDTSQEYLEEGINIFEQCFGFKPTMFKAPQLKISFTKFLRPCGNYFNTPKARPCPSSPKSPSTLSLSKKPSEPRADTLCSDISVLRP